VNASTSCNRTKRLLNHSVPWKVQQTQILHHVPRSQSWKFNICIKNKYAYLHGHMLECYPLQHASSSMLSTAVSFVNNMQVPTEIFNNFVTSSMPVSHKLPPAGSLHAFGCLALKLPLTLRCMSNVTQIYSLKAPVTPLRLSGFGGLVVSMVASGTQDHGFAPGWSRRNFSGEKILSMPSFGREVKPFVPCRRFAACQRTL
jgi:hypothetical protein